MGVNGLMFRLLSHIVDECKAFLSIITIILLALLASPVYALDPAFLPILDGGQPQSWPIVEPTAKDIDDSKKMQLAFGPAIQAVLSAGGAAINYCNDANAVGCWYMNSAGDADEVDRTSNGNDLAESASDTIASSNTVPSGYSGKSKDFEAGDTEYLTIADATELDISGANAKVSVCAWTNLESSPGATSYMYIVSKYQAVANGRQYTIRVYSADGSSFSYQFATSASSADGTNVDLVTSASSAYTAGNWYHVCGVSDDSDMRIYVNGSLACTPGDTCTAKDDGLYDTSSVFVIGSISGAGSYYDGLIDEVIVFNRGITATEVLNIYNNGITGTKGASD